MRFQLRNGFFTRMCVSLLKMRKSTNRPELVLVGDVSPIATGQSVSFQMLLRGLQRHNVNYVLIDYRRHDLSRRGERFGWRRAYEILRLLPRFLQLLLFGPQRTLYILIGQSKMSFLRDFVFVAPAILLGHRVVVHLKGGNYDGFYNKQSTGLQFLIRQTLARVDKIIILSEWLTSCFDFLENSTDKLVIVANALPFEQSEQETPISLKAGDKIQLLFLSNMIESKGYWALLEACRLLKERQIPFSCNFYGGFLPSSDDTRFDSASEAKEAVANAISEWNLEDSVFWHGPVYGDEKLEALRKAHCFVLPTNYVNEGQPVSIIEALAYGKVIITTRYRAIPDMVQEAHNGFFVDCDSPDQIADLVAWLWQHPEEVTRLSGNSLLKYRTGFTQERHFSEMLSVLLPDGNDLSESGS